MKKLFFMLVCLANVLTCGAQHSISGILYLENDFVDGYDNLMGDQPISDYAEFLLVELRTAPDSNIYAWTYSDGNGEFSFPSLPDGDYFFNIISGCPFGTYLQSGLNAEYSNSTWVDEIVIHSTDYSLFGGGTDLYKEVGLTSIFSICGPLFGPTGLACSPTTPSTMNLSWSRGDGDKVLVVASDSPIVGEPYDYVTYNADTVYGEGDFSSGYAVYSGTGTSVSISGLDPNKQYYFAAYEFFDDGFGATIYNVMDVSTSSCSTPSIDQYNGNMLCFNGSSDVVESVGNCPEQSLSLLSYVGEFTIELWVKFSDVDADGLQTFVGSSFDPNETGFFFGFDNRSSMGRDHQLLLELYNGSGTKQLSTYTSPGVITDTLWHHVAVTVNESLINFYVDGFSHAKAAGTMGTHSGSSSTRPASLGAVDNGNGSCDGSLGAYVTGNSGLYQHFFRGCMEELRIWWTQRSVSQIRENINLTLQGSEAYLISDFQFNESGGTDVKDHVSGNSGKAIGTTRKTSKVAVGDGSSATTAINASGTFTFPGTGVTMKFPTSSTYPDGDLVVTQLNFASYTTPAAATSVSDIFWVVRNFGSNQTFTALEELTFSGIGNMTATDAASPSSNLTLYKRSSNATTETWNSFGGASTANDGTGSVTFTTANNITSFSQAIIGFGVPLPVTLLSFEGTPTSNNRAKLMWVTTDEKDNDGFYVEARGVEEEAFQSMGFIKGYGDKASESHYNFITDELESGTYYFRLKQVDKDGKETYSHIVVVSINDGGVVVEGPNPNPTSGEATSLVISTQIADEFNVTLTDVLGNYQSVLYSGEIEEGTPLNLTIDAKGLEKGIYIIRVISSTTSGTKKLIVR